MSQDFSTRIKIIVPIATALILLAAVASAFAANSTGPRPVTTGAGNPFGINPGAGRGVATEGGTAGGGGGANPSPPPAPRPIWRHPHPPGS